MTTLYLDGNKIELGDQDYLSAGGQARVYRQGGIAYKVFDAEPPPRFEAKLEALRVLGRRKNIVAPQKLLRTGAGVLAGYTMAFVPAALPLPKLFPPGFQAKHGMTMSTVTGLVTQLLETTAFIHDQGFLVVDGNEFNYLVSDDFQRLYCIDVDSYQTPGFPATVIMPSIRDWLSADFHAGSDWFSFAVIATQLYLGIHPFRGTWKTHPEVRDLRERVVRKVSVFDPDVALPAAARDPSSIPAAFRDWLTRVFQEGERSRPPLPGAAPAATVRVAGPSRVRKEELAAWPAARRRPDETAPIGLEAETAVVLDGRLYAIRDGVLIELRPFETAAGRQWVERQRWPLSPHAFHVLDGVIVVDHLGAWFLVIPFAVGRCSQIRAASLDGHRVIDGRFHHRVAVVISARGEQRYRTVFHLSEDRETVLLEEQTEVDQTSEVNFVVLKGTTLVSLTDTLDLQVVGQSGTRTVDDTGALAGGQLMTDGERLYWFREKLFRLSLGSR